MFASLSDSRALWRFLSFGPAHNDGSEVPASAALLRFLRDRRSVGLVEQLNFEGCEVMPDDFLVGVARACPDLRRLNISFCQGVTSRGLWAIGQLQHLVVLAIRQVRGPAPVSKDALSQLLSRLPHIEFLDVGGLPLCDSGIAVIGKHMAQLKHLHLRECSGFTDISPLGHCRQLRYLSLRKCGVLDSAGVLAALSSLPHLRVLDIRWCWSLPHHLVRSFLRELPALTVLLSSLLVLDLPPGFTLHSNENGFRYDRVAAAGLHSPVRGIDAELCTYALAFSPSPANAVPEWLFSSAQLYPIGAPQPLARRDGGLEPKRAKAQN